MTAQGFHRHPGILLALASLTLACAAVLVGCSSRATQGSEEAAAEFEREGAAVVVPKNSALRARLKFDTADRQTVRRSLSVPASVEPDAQRYSRVYPPVAGRVVQFHVQLGDSVQKGQVLATLHAPDFMQAQSDYLKARSTLQIARRNLQRQQDLLAHKIAAQRDVEEAQNAYEAAQSDLHSASARLTSYGLDLEHDALGHPLQLLAPIAGRVVEMGAALGEFHNDGNAPLMTIADLSTVWLTAGVPEKDLRFIRKGEEARASLPAYPGETFTGAVTVIGDLLDADTRVVKVRVVVPNTDGRLKPGMFATVDFFDFPDEVITVPNTAIVQAGEQTVIYEQTQPWRLEPREVRLGPQLGDRTIVLAGIDSGASILSREGVLLQR